tara:strand:- start:371 stop:544 length:174 start_codon:yes stop_codon:yes gene_type:complete
MDDSQYPSIVDASLGSIVFSNNLKKRGVSAITKLGNKSYFLAFDFESVIALALMVDF